MEKKKIPIRQLADKSQIPKKTAKKTAGGKSVAKTSDKVKAVKVKKVKVLAQEFAVIATGGKQYKVAVGDSVTIEKLSDTTNVGDNVVFDKVSAVDNGTSLKLGAPYVDGAKVTAEIISQGKGEKLRVQRFRSKSNWHRAYGHRQPFVKVKIISIK